MDNIRKYKFEFVLFSFLVMIALISLVSNVQSNYGSQNIVSAEIVENFSQDFNIFAIELYKDISTRNPKDNIVISPASIELSFGMLYEGLSDVCSTEVREVFRFPKNDTIRRYAFLKLIKDLKNEKIRVANSIWVSKELKLNKNYEKTVKDFYLGEIFENQDFCSGNTVKLINGWVEQKTNEKIKEIVSSDDINCDTLVVILNAIYFKQKWKYEFDKSRTRTEKFYLNSSSFVKVNMMHASNLKLKYYEDSEVKALELPYKNENLSMIIILPKNIDKIYDLEKNLSYGYLDHILKSLKKEEISEIGIPKFEIEKGYELIPYLEDLGIRKIFQPGLCFSNMFGKIPAFVSRVKHKIYIKVDEEGTEASASTAIVITKSAPLNRKIFIANHPFIFIILDKKTNMILFIGRIYRPT